jgi:hypothetical protein
MEQYLYTENNILQLPRLENYQSKREIISFQFTYCYAKLELLYVLAKQISFEPKSKSPVATSQYDFDKGSKTGYINTYLDYSCGKSMIDLEKPLSNIKRVLKKSVLKASDSEVFLYELECINTAMNNLIGEMEKQTLEKRTQEELFNQIRSHICSANNNRNFDSHSIPKIIITNIYYPQKYIQEELLKKMQCSNLVNLND